MAGLCLLGLVHVLCFNMLNCIAPSRITPRPLRAWAKRRPWKIIVVTVMGPPANFSAAAISSKFAVYKSDPSSESSPLQGLFANFIFFNVPKQRPNHVLGTSPMNYIIVALALCNTRKRCLFTHFGKNTCPCSDLVIRCWLRRWWGMPGGQMWH